QPASCRAQRARSNAPTRPRPQQPSPAKKQHQDEHDENADLPERLPEIEAAETLHHADEQAADERTRHRAHAAEHDDGEGDEHEGVSDMRFNSIVRDQVRVTVYNARAPVT